MGEIAHGEMTDWRTRTRAFENLAVVGSVNWSVTLAGGAEEHSVPLAAVSASFFEVVGTKPLIGRALVHADEDGALPRVMVISHRLWVGRFGASAAVTRRPSPVRFDAGGPIVPVDIVGVMPPGFDFPRGADVWMPAAPLIRHSSGDLGGIDNAMRWLRVFFVLGRTRPGISRDDAARDLTHVMRTADIGDGPEANQSLVLTPIASYLLGPAEPVLWTLLGGALLMLAGACANVAGLQLARTAQHQRAMAVRIAIGASPGQLVLRAMLESAALTAAAGLLASVVAGATASIIVRLAPGDVPRLSAVSVFNLPVFAAAIVLVFAVLLGVGLWPSIAASRLDATSVLAHGGRAAGHRGGRRMQRAIVVVQVAIALTLIVGAALFARTLGALNHTALGFNPERLISLTVTPRTDDLQRWNAYYDALARRVSALPRVVSAAAVQLRPLSGPIGWDSQPVLPGQVPNAPSTWGLNPHMNLQTVTPGYFQTMGIRLVRGRPFTDADTRTSPGVVVVSEVAARRLWPGRDAIGQRLVHFAYDVEVPKGEIRYQTVVGVVEDVRYRGLTDVRLDCYMPASQSKNRVQQLMIRTEADPHGVLRSVRDASAEVDGTASISDATIMSDVVASESAPWRFLLRLFLSFAALAGVLAAIGLGAVITVSVASRRRELAIRAALGADRARLRAAVLGEGLRVVAIGIAGGLAAALVLGRAVRHLLVGVAPDDPLALVVASAVVGAVTVTAMWLPARRAAAADPLEALRAE